MNGRALAALVGFARSAAALGALPDTITEAREHAEKGLQCAQANDLVCAETELRRAVALAPEDASYLTSLGGILGMQEKFDSANLYLEKAVKSDPENAAARRNLAANEWRLGQLKPAQANLEHLLRVQPHDRAAMLLLGMVSENEHEYGRAVTLLSKLPDLVKEHPEAVAALASSCYHTGRRQQARQELEKLTTKDASVQGIFAGAGVAAQAEDYGIAEKLFQSIRSSYPDSAALEYNLALVQFRTERISESHTRLLGLVKTGHADAKIYNLLGKCYEKGNSLGEAIEAMKNAIRLEPAEESNYLDLVTILTKSNRLAAALEISRKTAEAFPKSELAYISKAYLEMKSDEFTDAVRSYGRAVELNPKSLDARLGLASAKWASGMRAEAEMAFKVLLQQHPRNGAVYQSYGTSLLNSAEDDPTLDRAATLLRRAVELNGSQAEAHYQLGILEVKRSPAGVPSESLKKGLEQLETAARLGRNDSKIHYALARIYRRFGRENDAGREMDLYDQVKAVEDDANPMQPTGAMQGK